MDSIKRGEGGRGRQEKSKKEGKKFNLLQGNNQTFYVQI